MMIYFETYDAIEVLFLLLCVLNLSLLYISVMAFIVLGVLAHSTFTVPCHNELLPLIINH